MPSFLYTSKHNLTLHLFPGCSWGENFSGSSTGTASAILSPISQWPLTVNVPILKPLWVQANSETQTFSSLLSSTWNFMILFCPICSPVFKYLLFFNFNNKRVRMTFSGGHTVFVGIPPFSAPQHQQLRTLVPCTCVARTSRRFDVQNGLPVYISQAQTDIFAEREMKLNKLSSFLLGLHKASTFIL